MACLAAGKTGTTNDKKDGWFCGFTRYYTTCVWVGCDMPETVKKLTGSSYPAEIWKNYMDQIHADLTPIDFLPYAQISDDYQDSQETQETPADDQTQNNPTDQTVTAPDAGTTTPDKTTTDTNKTDAAGGNHEKTPTTPSENPSGGAGDSGSAGGTGGAGDSGSAGDTGGAGDSGSTGGAGGAGGSGSTGGAGGAGGSGSTGGTGGATGGTTGGEAASRFFFAVLSGVVFFAAYASVTIGNKTIDALIYSVTYNGSYLAVEEIITIIVISIPPVKKALDYVKQMANSR